MKTSLVSTSIALCALWLPLGASALPLPPTDPDCPSCDAGLECENPAGTCTVTPTSSSCHCADGSGQGSSSASDPGGGEPAPTMTEEELAVLCQDTLIDACGTEAPDINDRCTPEQLDACAEIVPGLLATYEECGFLDDDGVTSSEEGSEDSGGDSAEEPPKPQPTPTNPESPEEFGAMAECCEMLAYPEVGELYQGFAECVAKAGSDCEAVLACDDEFEGEAGGEELASEDDKAEEDGDDTQATNDASVPEPATSACSVTAVAGRTPTSLLGLLFSSI